MTDNRSIASDATFFVLFIGFASAMLALSIALFMWSMYDSFTADHSIATVVNVLGWLSLPFGPSAYRRLTGRPFALARSSAIA
jgi:hypothetical protein